VIRPEQAAFSVALRAAGGGVVGHFPAGIMVFPIPDPIRSSTLPVATVSCLIDDGTRDAILHAAPLQLAAAIATKYGANAGPENEAFLESLCFAAQHGRITGRMALEEDIEVLVAQLLSSHRRTRRGSIPFRAACRVRRFLRGLREP